MMDLDALLLMLSCAPNEQIDHSVTKRIEALVGAPPVVVATKLKEILDDCAHAALASDFSMLTMDQVWRIALDAAQQ